tara:strand:- start:508 stop:819 length:312 start_codon:yes stop_codon:yes gene_type:complete
MKLLTSVAALALGLSLVAPSSAKAQQIHDEVGTCNQHGWTKSFPDGDVVSIGKSHDFIITRGSQRVTGGWTYETRRPGVVSLHAPNSSVTHLRIMCPGGGYRF